jgi:hypothetical protein
MAEVPEIPTDMPEIAPDNAEIAPDNAEIAPDNAESASDNAEIVPDIVELPDIEELPELPPKPKAKARGRPKGAANKGPSKPRAKKVQAPPVVEAPVYEPSSPKRNLSIPSYDRTDELASQMLRLLASQAQGRQQKKRELYASWMR